MTLTKRITKALRTRTRVGGSLEAGTCMDEESSPLSLSPLLDTTRNLHLPNHDAGSRPAERHGLMDSAIITFTCSKCNQGVQGVGEIYNDSTIVLRCPCGHEDSLQEVK